MPASATTATGKNADYIPALASVPSQLFGVCLVGVSGTCYGVGDHRRSFTIQSISKPFVFALICQAIGEEEARRLLGVNSTGLPFNSVIAVERSSDGLTNPMVNAGRHRHHQPGAGGDRRGASGDSSATACRASPVAPWRSTRWSTGPRPPPISATPASPTCCRSYDRIYFDPLQATDIYTRQCALRVTARDLAVMAATLANGGVNPGHPRAGDRCHPLSARPGRHGDRRALRELRRLAL